MLHPCARRSLFAFVLRFLTGSFLVAGLIGWQARAQVLVGDPFIASYEDWIDPVPERGGNWRISLINPTIMETSDIVPGGSNPPAATNNGSYNPSLLIQDGFTSPANYDLRARMYSSDDDGFGVVFGYQNPDNYFRAFLRWQANGNLGGTPGVSVQKVVNGVATQITPVGIGPGNTLAPSTEQIANREPIDVRVAVTGQNYNVYVAGINGDQPLASGTDPDLMPGKVGVQSWAQRVGPATPFGPVPHWGTEVETVSVSQGATTLYSGSFGQAALPVQWKPLLMTNSAGLRIDTTGVGEDVGNFGADIDGRYFYQQTNGFEYATLNSENVDFTGPAVVVDEPGSTAFSNYQLRARLGATDDDGIGVVVRAQDDNNFYRINFSRQSIVDTANSRAPQGMSVQKVRNGAWTELFRDDQDNPLFVYQNGPGNPNTTLPMFDVAVSAVNNTLKVQVTDHTGKTIEYPLITDASDPLLTGSVGFTTWGTDNVYYAGYGGGDGPLLSAINEIPNLDLTINRDTGNITLANNGSAAVAIRGVSIHSRGGALKPADWTSISDAYDEPPGNGSVDPDDPWTELAATVTELSESEQSGGNGGSLAMGQSVNLGNIWTKSRIEDVTLDIELASGGVVAGGINFVGGPGGMAFGRSDLNADGVVNASDWPLFHPHMLADLNSLTQVGRALAGDLDLDGDNDVDDFAVFKADFDAANGAGAFNAMVASLPEPSAVVLLGIGAIGGLLLPRSRRAASRLMLVGLAMTFVVGWTDSATAVPIDLTTYTVEAFPASASFPVPVWDITPSSATLNNNADANILYSPESAFDKRFVGRLTPGTDDDVVGFVLGFEPGDAQIGSAADYLLIDWKGANQDFNFADGNVINFFQDTTLGGPMPVGLALSRVTGSPTADEFWQHTDLPENTFGSVTQLARGATLGSSPYNRTNGSHLFEMRYTATNVTVLVDGIEQFNLDGTFPDGRFGLYTAWQGPQPTFSDFEVFDLNFGLSATVDRGTGAITLRNASNTPFEFDYYQIDSPSGSLNLADWNSLSDQEFQSVGTMPGQSWDEAGGSDATALAEVFLQAGAMMAANSSVTIGNAYNGFINGEDLVLSFRLTSGDVLTGVVSYAGTPPEMLSGDYNMNGVVDAADYVVWRKNDGTAPGYELWRANFGRTSAGGAALAGAQSVPEPTSIVLLGMVTIGTMLGVRRRAAA